MNTVKPLLMKRKSYIIIYLIFMKTNIFFSVISILLLCSFSQNSLRIGRSDLKSTIAGISKGDISKDILLDTGTILCSDQKIEVIYFSLSVMKQNDLIVYKGSGNTLTESMKTLIKELETGTKIIIDEIGARSPNDQIIKLPALILTLK